MRRLCAENAHGVGRCSSWAKSLENVSFGECLQRKKRPRRTRLGAVVEADVVWGKGHNRDCKSQSPAGDLKPVSPDQHQSLIGNFHLRAKRSLLDRISTPPSLLPPLPIEKDREGGRGREG